MGASRIPVLSPKSSPAAATSANNTTNSPNENDRLVQPAPSNSSLRTPPKRVLHDEKATMMPRTDSCGGKRGCQRLLDAYGQPIKNKPSSSPLSERTYRNDKRPSIKVIVRKRPVISISGQEKSSVDICHIQPNKHSVLVEEHSSQTTLKEPCRHLLQFDRVYDCDADNCQIYEDQCLQQVVGCVEEGSSLTVFAFGHTGSGKTHTLFHWPTGTH